MLLLERIVSSIVCLTRIYNLTNIIYGQATIQPSPGLCIMDVTRSHYQNQDFKYVSVQPYLEGGRSLFLPLYIQCPQLRYPHSSLIQLASSNQLRLPPSL